MLSLRRAISRIEREERIYDAALGCYVSAVAALEEYPMEATPEAARIFREALRGIRAEVEQTHDADVLERSRETLRGVTKTHFSHVAAKTSEKTEDLKAVMSALAEAAQWIGERHAGHADKLRDFTNRLQATERVTDLGAIRRQIVGHVAELRVIGEATKKDNEDALASLRSQLAEFNRRLDDAEQRACLDGLTGLLNRGEGEKRLTQMVQTGRTVSAILVDLNRFKQINDRWGHTAGDQVLKTCARILAEQTRPGDGVCRWGGDEFLLTLHCEEAVVLERAEVLKRLLKTPQKIVVLGKIFEVAVSASVGTARLHENETSQDFIARVDAEMYRDKARVRELAGV
ncbi:MAG: GGDEF domain-containing protein [Acidobacteriota bacterium]|nr:GGDEF domain-containing protein [Acidobacteriota bacterium]